MCIRDRYLYYDDWTIVVIDITAAFLEGKMDIETFIEIPDGMVELGFVTQKDRQEKIIRLLKSMYGNVDAALRFFNTYKEAMTGFGMTQSQADPCLFYKKIDNVTVLIVICFVDDTMLIGKQNEIDWFKSEIDKHFKYTEEGKLTKHLGVRYEFKEDEKGDEYIEAKMDKLVMKIVNTYQQHVGKEANIAKTPGTPGQVLMKNEGKPKDPEMYRKIVGQIMYLVTKIFPEGANAARELTRHFSNPNDDHWKEVGRFVGYLKHLGKDIKLTYRKPKEMRVMSVVDSNYATDKDTRRSVSGGIHTLGGSIVSWVSKTQTSTTLSSTEAEYVSLSMGAQEVKFMQMLLEELVETKTPGIILEDNTGAIYLVRNQQVGQRTKHIDVRYHFIRELVGNQEIAVNFVKSKDNESDIMTKNVTENLQVLHGTSIRNGTMHFYGDWYEIVEEALERTRTPTDMAQREDVEIWRDVGQTKKQSGPVD